MKSIMHSFKMSKGRRTAQTPFEKEDEFHVEKVLAKRHMKVAIESTSTNRVGRKPNKQKESILHYEIKWRDYEATTWEPIQCEFSGE